MTPSLRPTYLSVRHHVQYTACDPFAADDVSSASQLHLISTDVDDDWTLSRELIKPDSACTCSRPSNPSSDTRYLGLWRPSRRIVLTAAGLAQHATRETWLLHRLVECRTKTFTSRGQLRDNFKDGGYSVNFQVRRREWHDGAVTFTWIVLGYCSVLSCHTVMSPIAYVMLLPITRCTISALTIDS